MSRVQLFTWRRGCISGTSSSFLSDVPGVPAPSTGFPFLILRLRWAAAVHGVRECVSGMMHGRRKTEEGGTQ